MNTEYNNGVSSDIQLKGTNFGVRVIFPDDIADDELLKMFASIPDKAYTMPEGMGIILDFQGRLCSERFITRILREVIWPKKFRVLAWLSVNENSSERFKEAGFHVAEPGLERGCAGTAPRNLVINHSLRSGQHEEYVDDVILAGHLNEGAELFAGGSVFVLGKLKGLVHAGCSGTDGVCVVAGSFEARQLRIGDKLCDQFGSGMKWWKKPVIITLEGDGLLFKEWPAS